jgi:Cellulase (glycosyl hydrolase family 5)
MTRILPALLLLLMLGFAAPASAAGPQVGIADDRIMQAGGPAADKAIAEWKKLGIDDVRLLVYWNQIAPGDRSRTAPAGFDADNPNDPQYSWYVVDQAVNRIRAAGLSVTLNVTGPGPYWSSSAPSRRRGAWKPKAASYGAFAEAVALRYGAQVDRYILWNEPNLNKWIAPQSTCKRGRCTPASPHIYRNLVRAGYSAIKANDARAEIVVGALGPRGKEQRTWKSTMHPMLFLRHFGCRSDSFKRIRTGSCKRFKPATLDGFGVHPYSFRAPERPNPGADSLSIAQLPNLIRTLDRLKRARALRSTTRKIGVFIDEYGYQTRPQDPFAGITTAQQDSYLQRAAYHAWRTKRVKLFTQYLWEDEVNRVNWQSGLRDKRGRAKRSLAHFDTPFAVDASRRLLWGQVRPGGSTTVRVEQKRGGSWRLVKSQRTDSRGYFSVRRSVSRGTYYRFRAGKLVSQAVRG